MNKNKNPFVSYSEFFTKLDPNTEKVSPEILDMKFKDLTMIETIFLTALAIMILGYLLISAPIILILLNQLILAIWKLIEPIWDKIKRMN